MGFYCAKQRRSKLSGGQAGPNTQVTLWLNGGPASDSFIGAFEEVGPWEVLENMTTALRGYAWSEITDLLFLSQPVGTGAFVPISCRFKARYTLLIA